MGGAAPLVRGGVGGRLGVSVAVRGVVAARQGPLLHRIEGALLHAGGVKQPRRELDHDVHIAVAGEGLV